MAVLVPTFMYVCISPTIEQTSSPVADVELYEPINAASWIKTIQELKEGNGVLCVSCNYLAPPTTPMKVVIKRFKYCLGYQTNSKLILFHRNISDISFITYRKQKQAVTEDNDAKSISILLAKSLTNALSHSATLKTALLEFYDLHTSSDAQASSLLTTQFRRF
ncbi:MAG: hypothetical protein ACPGUD_09485 [Parashewanella sp.]